MFPLKKGNACRPKKTPPLDAPPRVRAGHPGHGDELGIYRDILLGVIIGIIIRGYINLWR